VHFKETPDFCYFFAVGNFTGPRAGSTCSKAFFLLFNKPKLVHQGEGSGCPIEGGNCECF
jgi:hypothetical protein